MSIADIFQTCVICPGICKLDCPIYASTRDIRSAPDRLGWAGYSVLARNDYDTLYNLELCTGCGYCSESCPIHNELPKAIFKARTLIQDVLGEKIPKNGYIELSLDPSKEYLASDASIYDVSDIIKNLGLEFLDTSELYLFKSYGYNLKIDENTSIFTEDMDVFKPDAKKIYPSIMYELPRETLGAYTLHIPCKAKNLRESIIARATELYGKPTKILIGCSGVGGYLFKTHPALASIALRKFFRRIRGTILTLCIHTWEALSKTGYKAITPIIVYRGDING